jgi:hypothetical protein
MSLFLDHQPRYVSAFWWHRSWFSLDIMQGFLLEALLANPMPNDREVIVERVGVGHTTHVESGSVEPADRAWFEAWLARGVVCRNADVLPWPKLQCYYQVEEVLAIPIRKMPDNHRDLAVELVLQFKRADTIEAEIDWRILDATRWWTQLQNPLKLCDGDAREAIAGAIVGLDRHDLGIGGPGGPWAHLFMHSWDRLHVAINKVLNIAPNQTVETEA